uniref:Toll-like receptor 2 n=1 Tax=Crassostrea virginica TaxID=6565 RepID=A0A8B8BPG2_CRAVI|nr:toll-like receptor 2 [Crassostrea virginica]XP_022305214.1 toll-like receptor 2 [Crassostrea virginica]XP_022305215.1 toll-like receptor 2 [Crassostrea virginica]
MLYIIQALVIGSVFLMIEAFNCSSNEKCHCVDFKGKYFAYCNGLGLRSAPSFSDDVIGISLVNNDISEFPASLPVGISYLDISKNSLREIRQNSLAKYTFLRNLSVSENELKSIELGSLRKAGHLIHLDLSLNQELTIEVLVNISHDLKNSTSIRVLNLEYLQCTFGTSFIVKQYHIADLRHTLLEELNLASNHVSFEFGVLSMLPKTIKYLNVANNVLSYGYYLAEFGSLQNLVSLNISYQSFVHQVWVQNFVPENPDTGEVMGKFSYCSQSPENITIYFPPKMQVLYFHDNMYKLELPDFTFKSVDGPKLTHVHLQNNIIYSLTGPITGLSSVVYADLSNNFCSYISPKFFNDFQNMSFLDLSHNALGEIVEKDVTGNIFRNLFKLKYLNLTRNRIVRLPDPIFRNLIHLKQLNLSYNSLSEFTIPINHMNELRSLDLSNNQISFLDQSTRDNLDTLSRAKQIYVNLKANRLLCNCEHMDFVKWMRQSRNVIFVNFNEYTCSYMNSSRVSFSQIDRLLQQMEKRCASYTCPIVFMTSLIIVILTTTFSRILYRYRWKLRYMYYVAREKYRDNVQGSGVMGGESSYYFDAFVSYADKDRGFVIDLVKSLEKEHNLKLCIHHRDFIPGTGIADNITNAIHFSRRTVCIMTSPFLESYWCMFELNMARMEAIYSREGENVLFLVVLEKNAMAKLPFSFIDLVESKSYLEFPENEDSDESSAFRSKLGAILKSHDCEFRSLVTSSEQE